MCKGEIAPVLKQPTLAELRAVIPPHCFERSALRSLWLVCRDALVMAAVFVIATSLLKVPTKAGLPLTFFDWIGWAIYAFAQGTAAIGWWVLAHECGHGGFSPYRLLNDTVGWVLHSVLLVPYFSWQYSHAKHHSKTNHLVDGESHVPETLEDLIHLRIDAMHSIVGDDCFAVLHIIAHVVVGWPMYLFFNATGGRRLAGKELKKPFPGLVDHFRPNSSLFPNQWRIRVALSTVGVLLTLAGLVWCMNVYGVRAVMVCYFGPYMWVNFWLVLYTWLQHTDPSLPHYGEGEWTWLKGALSTIDRPYTFFDWFHHHIGSTHVCHHVFSTLPCYHAQEATRHLRKYLEPLGLYNYDATPWPLAAWHVAKTCHFVQGVEGIQYYQSFSQVDKKGQ